MTTKLGSELEVGDTIHFDRPGATAITHTITGFSEHRPFMGCHTVRSAAVRTGNGPRAFGIVTLRDSETFRVS